MWEIAREEIQLYNLSTTSVKFIQLLVENIQEKVHLYRIFIELYSCHYSPNNIICNCLQTSCLI